MQNAQCVMRNVTIFILGLLILLLSQIANAASVTDEVGLLSDMEIELLNQRIANIEQAHNIKIGVSFVESIGKSNMITASNDLVDQYVASANGVNVANGGIVLLVAMDKRKYEMATDKRMMNIITNHDGIPFLKKNFQPELKKDNYYKAANNFIDGVDELMTYYETNGVAYPQTSYEGSGSYETNNNDYNYNAPAFDPVAAAIAFVGSIVLGVIIRSVLIGSMSNIHHAQAAIDYLKKNTVKFTENRDTFLFMNVQRKTKGGGNRGGGNRGGGGSHGSSHGGGGGSF